MTVCTLELLRTIHQRHSGSCGITVSVSVSASQLVSLTGICICEAYTSWPWPCIYLFSHTSVSRVYCPPKTPKFPGMLVEFWLFFQVSVVCALRDVLVNSHTAIRDKHASTVTCIYKPCHMEAHTLYSREPTAATCVHAAQMFLEIWSWHEAGELIKTSSAICCRDTAHDNLQCVFTKTFTIRFMTLLLKVSIYFLIVSLY